MPHYSSDNLLRAYRWLQIFLSSTLRQSRSSLDIEREFPELPLQEIRADGLTNLPVTTSLAYEELSTVSPVT